MRQKILDFMRMHNHCVISTIGPEGYPQSALVGFSQNDGLELIIGTTSDSRKYKNIVQSPHVAIVIGFGEDKTSIQYEGTASLLEGEEKGQRLEAHYRKLPAALKHNDSPTQVYFKIQPLWVRYTDIGAESKEMEELRFPT